MRINKLFFWITSSTTVLSLFLFIFGLSSFAYYMTGIETSDMGSILRILQQLPDPRYFLNQLFDIYNALIGRVSDLMSKWRQSVNDSPDFLRWLVNLVSALVNLVSMIISILITFVVGWFVMPIYVTYWFIGAFTGLLNLFGYSIPSLPQFDFTGWLGI